MEKKMTKKNDKKNNEKVFFNMTFDEMKSMVESPSVEVPKFEDPKEKRQWIKEYLKNNK